MRTFVPPFRVGFILAQSNRHYNRMSSYPIPLSTGGEFIMAPPFVSAVQSGSSVSFSFWQVPCGRAYGAWIRLVLCCCFLLLAASGMAQSDSALALTPEEEIVYLPPDPAAALAFIDSLVQSHPMARGTVVSAISKERIMHDDTADFYLLLALFLLLGLIRTQDRRYFQSIARLFFNPIRSPRQLTEQMYAAARSNFLMNVFFAVAVGAYLYYVVRVLAPTPGMVPALWMVGLVVGVAVVYSVKYLVVRVCGWAFRAEAATEQYLFNVFLVNKIIAIALLPFVVLLAFGDEGWQETVVVVSVIMVGFLMLNRYVRSWQIFGSFFQYSRFHFFMYLCASELLPLAVLIKLMIQWTV